MALPRVREEQAWVGIRWTIRRKNFAHVLMIVDGHPAAYAKAADSDGPLCILTFRSELAAFDPAVFKTGKYFKPVWFRNIAGMRIDDDTNWDAVKDHIEASYRQLSGSKQEST
jgi:hypothetical protein